jgi:phage terminase large subunit-like protein
MKSVLDDIRKAAESDLYQFARLINPLRVYGDVHKEVFKWLMNKDKPNQLLLLPRSHMKSHCIAVWCAWWITKNPATTILYLSATSDLAEKQLFAIKQMLDSDIYRRYWPQMTHPDEGKRAKWSSTEIMVDHPIRILEGVRDPTLRAAGLTTTTTGSHADVLVPDDVVVPDNAYTEEGRRKVSAAMSQMASILNTGGIVKACGTRYHPADQYSIWLSQKVQIFNDSDEVIDEEPIWDVFERVVEINGVFLWPREARDDGKEFGFNRRELARISAMYTDRTQFYAQYYNDPNDPESNRLDHSRFQYYDPVHVRQEGGVWFFKNKRLNVYAAIDFAFSRSKKADYTAIVVVGIDSEGYIYVLDIDRFKTDKIAEYYERVILLHSKWQFKKLRAEVTVAQSIICNDLKDRIRQEGMSLSIDEFRPTRNLGTKEERIAAVLEPRYEALTIFHKRGGHTPALEEELLLARPQHDDLKDCLASVVEIAKPPSRRNDYEETQNIVPFSRRFGGVSYKS